MTEEQATYKTTVEGAPKEAPGEFRTLMGVVEYLQGEGWKVTKSTLDRHIRAGRLRKDGNGAYPKAAVDRYAISWLKKMSDAEKVKAEKLAEEEKKERIGYQRALRKKMEMQLAILEQRYVERRLMYLELASRAAVLDAGLQATIQLRAEAWVAACGGDHGRVAELIRAASADMDELVNGFSTTRRFHVVYGGEEDGTRMNTEDRGEEEEVTTDTHGHDGDDLSPS